MLNSFIRTRPIKNLNLNLLPNQTISIAMSGGVDSAVVASLLIRSGYHDRLKPIFVKNWMDDSDLKPDLGVGCQWKRDWNDVQSICDHLKLPSQLIDLSKAYWNQVWEPCLRIWESGGSEPPNPDVMCNRQIKFGILADHLLRSDPQTLLATGHYARLKHTKNGTTELYQAVSEKSKDQSYYLSTIPSRILRRCLFPLGEAGLNKQIVRKLALEFGLPNASKAESMGICLVEPKIKRFEDFLATQIESRKGEIVLLEDEKTNLGYHQGIWNYTIGQRCGLNTPHLVSKQKMYVAKKDFKANRIFVVPHHEHPALYTKKIFTTDFQWINPPTVSEIPLELSARVRTGTLEPIPCQVKFSNLYIFTFSFLLFILEFENHLS
ncbi:tRNA-specific 2-thiouridylase [Melampsora americana]|nr:tRNA-specific 2-thiouridylase [Melampsora americana]